MLCCFVILTARGKILAKRRQVDALTKFKGDSLVENLHEAHLLLVTWAMCKFMTLSKLFFGARFQADSNLRRLYRPPSKH